MNVFSKGQNISLNACVGRNGWPDTGYYANGFDDAVHIMCRATITKGCDPDEIIYPIVFCARHRIELFLKMQIRVIAGIKDGATVPEPKLMRTHDLRDLWDMYVEVARLCDPRFESFILVVELAILEFAEVDPTGETFRYAYDNNNKKHLEDKISLINVEVFYSAFCTLSKALKELEVLADFLHVEYCTGTYTKFASRLLVEEISKDLPLRTSWGDDGFREVKKEIAEKYGLSQRNLSEVIGLISSHREFAFNVGEELLLEDISAEKILRFLELRIKVTSESEALSWRELIWSGPEWGAELYRVLINSYSITEMSALLAIADVAGRMRYSEEYDEVLESYKSGEDDVVEFAGYLYGKSFIAPKIIDGLKKMRQISTLKLICDAGIKVS